MEALPMKPRLLSKLLLGVRLGFVSAATTGGLRNTNSQLRALRLADQICGGQCWNELSPDAKNFENKYPTLHGVFPTPHSWFNCCP